jgi:hypothetical protein
MRSIAAVVALVWMAWPPKQACAQEVSFADLQGTEIKATVVQQRQYRRDGEVGSHRARQELFLAIGPGEKLRHTQVVNITSAKGSSSKTYSAEFVLGKPRNFRDGQAVWVFVDGELRRLRTLDTGGQVVVFSFAHAGDGLSCKVAMPFAREDGGGSLRTTSTNRSGASEILSSKELSTECRITRK